MGIKLLPRHQSLIEMKSQSKIPIIGFFVCSLAFVTLKRGRVRSMDLSLLNQIKDIKRGQSMEGDIICEDCSLERANAVLLGGATSFTIIHWLLWTHSESSDPHSMKSGGRHGGLGSNLGSGRSKE